MGGAASLFSGKGRNTKLTKEELLKHLGEENFSDERFSQLVDKDGYVTLGAVMDEIKSAGKTGMLGSAWSSLFGGSKEYESGADSRPSSQQESRPASSNAANSRPESSKVKRKRISSAKSEEPDQELNLTAQSLAVEIDEKTDVLHRLLRVIHARRRRREKAEGIKAALRQKRKEAKAAAKAAEKERIKAEEMAKAKAAALAEGIEWVTPREKPKKVKSDSDDEEDEEDEEGEEETAEEAAEKTADALDLVEEQERLAKEKEELEPLMQEHKELLSQISAHLEFKAYRQPKAYVANKFVEYYFDWIDKSDRDELTVGMFYTPDAVLVAGSRGVVCGGAVVAQCIADMYGSLNVTHTVERIEVLHTRKGLLSSFSVTTKVKVDNDPPVKVIDFFEVKMSPDPVFPVVQAVKHTMIPQPIPVTEWDNMEPQFRALLGPTPAQLKAMELERQAIETEAMALADVESKAFEAERKLQEQLAREAAEAAELEAQAALEAAAAAEEQEEEEEEEYYEEPEEEEPEDEPEPSVAEEED